MDEFLPAQDMDAKQQAERMRGKISAKDCLLKNGIYQEIGKEVQLQKRTDVLNCGYTFLSIHAIICMTGRKAKSDFLMFGSLSKCQFHFYLSSVTQSWKTRFSDLHLHELF